MSRKKPISPRVPETDATSSLEIETPTKPLAHCGNCIYWKPLEADFGHCLHNPPSIPTQTLLTAHGPRVTFGVTSRDMVCGRHPLFLAG